MRHQLAILERKQKRAIKPNRTEKLILAILTASLKQMTIRSAAQLRDIIRIFQPETVLRWHRALVRRKWTFKRQSKGGRPPISRVLEALIVRLARENGRWVYGKIEGELLKLGFDVSVSMVRNVLKRHGILPAPVRHGSIGWRQLMGHYNQQLLGGVRYWAGSSATISALLTTRRLPSARPVTFFRSVPRVSEASGAVFGWFLRLLLRLNSGQQPGNAETTFTASRKSPKTRAHFPPTDCVRGYFLP